MKANVICSDSAMTVEMDKSSFGGLVGHLRLNDPSNVACSLERQQNSTHFIVAVPLSGCGTLIQVNNEFLSCLVASVWPTLHFISAFTKCQFCTCIVLCVFVHNKVRLNSDVHNYWLRLNYFLQNYWFRQNSYLKNYWASQNYYLLHTGG